MKSRDELVASKKTMRCIFCKQASGGSRSVEHIVPESLGNTEHVLPRGVVCDSCNNYLAREVEAPFLASGSVRDQRFQMSVPNKRGLVPSAPGIAALGGMTESPFGIELRKSLKDPGVSINVLREQDEARFIRALKGMERGTLYVPVGMPAEGSVISRFVGKVGLEALAARAIKVQGGLDEIVDKPELDEIRNHVRRGYPTRVWPLHRRQTYAADHRFIDSAEAFELLHEYDLLYTDSHEMYIVLAIFGVEYALNLGGPEIEGYERWLSMNSSVSPLYSGKNAQNRDR
jgi:hypothetical protein